MSGIYSVNIAVPSRSKFSEKHNEISHSCQTTIRAPQVPCKFHRIETDFDRRENIKIKVRSRIPAKFDSSGKDTGKLVRVC